MPFWCKRPQSHPQPGSSQPQVQAKQKNTRYALPHLYTRVGGPPVVHPVGSSENSLRLSTRLNVFSAANIPPKLLLSSSNKNPCLPEPTNSTPLNGDAQPKDLLDLDTSRVPDLRDRVLRSPSGPRKARLPERRRVDNMGHAGGRVCPHGACRSGHIRRLRFHVRHRDQFREVPRCQHAEAAADGQCCAWRLDEELARRSVEDEGPAIACVRRLPRQGFAD